VVSGVTVNRTVAGSKRSAPISEWSRNPVATVYNTASLKGQPLWKGEVVKDHEMLGEIRDRRKSQNALELLESEACDCVLV